MATEADIAESVSITKNVGESIYLERLVDETIPGEVKKLQGMLNLPPETAQHSAETENKQVAIEPEPMITVIEGNVETAKAEKFFESPYAVEVAAEETCRVSKHCQDEEEPIQGDKEISEDEKQESIKKIEVRDEKGIGGIKIMPEPEEIPEKNDMSSDIVHHSGNGFQMEKIEEPNLRTGEEILEEERVADQHAEVVIDQDVSVEDKSTEKETMDMHKNEKDGILEATGETSHEEVEYKEAEKSTNLVCQEKGPEATEACESVGNEKDEKEISVDDNAREIFSPSIAVHPDNQSDEEATLKIREGVEETVYKPSITTATDVSSAHEAGPEAGEELKKASVVACEEKSQDVTEPSEEIKYITQVDDEMSQRDSIDTVATQTEETCSEKVDSPESFKVPHEIQSDDIIKENPKEVKEQIEVIEKTKEDDSISSEKGKDYENPETEGDASFVKHEGTLSVNEEVAAADASSVSSRYEEESTVIETKENSDDTKIISALENSQDGTLKHEDKQENLQQNGQEEEKLEGSISVVNEDFIVYASTEHTESIACVKGEESIKVQEESFEEKTTDALEHCQNGTSDLEERHENLQQNKPEKEKIEESSSVVAEDIGMVAPTEPDETSARAKGETPFKSQEESCEEIIKEDLPIHTDTVSENEIAEEKNIPPIELNEKIECAQVEVPDTDTNDLQVTDPLVEAALENESKTSDNVPNYEAEGQVREANEASMDEEKHMEDAPEAHQSGNCTILDHPSTEGEVTTELIAKTSEKDVVLQEVYGLESEEKSVIKDSGEKTDEEIRNNEEACETVKPERVDESDDAVKSTIDAETPIEVNTAILTRDEKVEQELQADIPLEAEPALKVEDKIYVEDNNERTNVTNEEVKDGIGTNITGSVVPINEQVMEGIAAHISEESIKQEIDQVTPENGNNAEKSEGENIIEQTSEESNSASVEQVPEELPKGEIYETSKSETKAERIEKETSKTIESSEELTATEISVGEKPHKNESGEKLEQPFWSTENESSDADKIPCPTEDGPPQNLEEAPQKTENEEGSEENNNAKEIKITAEEEDLEVVAETSDATRTTESIALELESEIDNTVIEDETKKEESIELNEDGKEAGKQTLKEENLVDQSSELEVEKIKQSVNEDHAVACISPELVEQEKVEISGENSVKEILEETNVTGHVPELVEQAPHKNTEDNEKKAEDSTAEIYETSKTEAEAESIEKETSKNIESSEEIAATKTSVEEKPQKNEPGEELERPFSSNKNETFSSDADKIPCLTEDGASKNLEEGSEENNNVKENKIIEEDEDLQVVAETSDATRTTESIVLELKSELDSKEIEDEIKEESKELNEDGKEAGKQTLKEENLVDQSSELEVEKIEQGFNEDQAVACISQESVEQETVQILGENSVKQIPEETNITGHVPESVEQIPFKNIEDNEKKAEDSTGEIFENSKAEEEAESIENETSDTIECRKEIIDTSVGKQESVHSEEKNITATESSPEEKPQEIEPGEKLERTLSLVSGENETFSSDANEIECLVEEAAPRDLEEAPWNERKETEEDNGSKENKIAIEEDLQVLNETTEASKSSENVSLEVQSENHNIDVEDETRKVESKESEDLKDTKKDEETEKHDSVERGATTTIFPEPSGEKVLQISEEDEKEEETPKIEACAQLETTSVHEDAEKQTPKEEDIVDKSSEFEGEARISSESVKQETVEISGENSVKKILEETNITSLVPESVEQIPFKTTEDDEKKAEDSTGEVVESSKKEDEAESIENETSRTIDWSEENVQSEGKDIIATESSLQENESGEEIERNSPLASDENESFSSDANKVQCLVEEGASQSLEEAQQSEEKETEKEDNDTKENKIATEEDLQVLDETTEASKSIKSIDPEAELQSEIDNEAVEEEIKKEESKESEELKDTEKEEETEKHDLAQECGTATVSPEPVGEKVLQSSEEDEKEAQTPQIEASGQLETISVHEDAGKQTPENIVDQSSELEGEKIEPSVNEVHAIACISSVEISGENSVKQILEETNIAGHVPESVGQIPSKNIEDNEKKAEESTGEFIENAKIEEEESESIENETSKTIECHKEILDTTQGNQGENVQSEGKNIIATESSPEEKSQENESGEKIERTLPLVSDENENFSLVEEGACQTLEEVPQSKEKETEASKSTESKALEPQSEIDNIAGEDEIKKEECEESEDLKDTKENEETEKHDSIEGSGVTTILPEPIGEKVLQSSEEDKKEEKTPKFEVCAQLETTSLDEDAEKENLEEESIVDKSRELEVENIEQSSKEEETPRIEACSQLETTSGDEDAGKEDPEKESAVEQSKELEIEKIEESSKEDNAVAYISSGSIEQETVKVSQGNEDMAEESEGEKDIEQIVEESSIGGLIPESVQQVPIDNLTNEEKKAEETTGENFENSKIVEATESIENETSKTIESPEEICDTTQGKQGEDVQSEGKNITATESSSEEKPQEIEPGEKLEQTLSLVSEQNETFSSDANKIQCLVEDAASQNPEEAKGNQDKEREENNDTKENQIASEEDLEVLDETTEASKSTENIALEAQAEIDNIAVKDEVKKEESEESEELKDTEKDEETEKLVSAEECGTATILPQPIGEKALQSSAEEKKGEQTPKIEECEQLETTSVDEEAEKQTLKEETIVEQSRELEVEKIEQSSREEETPTIKACSQLETTSVNEDAGKEDLEKENIVEQSRSLESEKIEESSEEDNAVACISSGEQETIEICQGNENKAEVSEGEKNVEQIVEESSISGLILQSVQQVPIDKVNEEKKEEENIGENFENAKTLEAAESTENETSKTIESPKEILDTVQEKQRELMQSEIKNPAVTESTVEEKPQQNESGEKLEHETLSSDADKIPCLTEEEAPQNPEEVPKKEENEKEETNFNETEDSKTASEKDLEVDAETSDEGNSTETIVLKPKSEVDDIAVEEELKKEESKQSYEDFKDGVKEKHDIIEEECSTANILAEPLGEKVLSSPETPKLEACTQLETTSVDEDAEKQTLEEGSIIDQSREIETEKIEQSSRKEETPRIEAYSQLETTSVDEDDEKQVLEKEGIVDQSREIEIEKIEESSKEENTVAHISEFVEQETVEISQGNENRVEKSEEDKNIEQIIEESSSRGLIPEPVRQVPVNNLEDEEKKEEETSVENFENSKKEESAESIAHESSETIESHKEILDTSQVTKVESLQSEEKNQTASESSAEETINEDKSPVVVTEENKNDSQIVDDKDITEMKVSEGEDDIEQSSQKNGPGEETEQPLSLISDDNQAFSSDGDKIPHLMEEGASENLKEARKKDEKEKEVNNDTEDNKVPKEEDLQVADEQSDARKSTDSITLEQKLEMVHVEVEEKKEVSKELYEDWNDAGKDKETEKHDIQGECSSTDVLLEPIEEKVLHSSEQDEKEEETSKIEACVPLETTSGDEDAGKQTPKDNIVEESRELDVELEQISKEDDSAAKVYKQEVCEPAQTVDGNEDAGKQNRGAEAEKKSEACSRIETSVDEDAGKEDLERENIVEQSRELEIEKSKESSKKEDAVASISSGEQETVEISQGNENKAEVAEGENNVEHTVEESSISGLILESVQQVPIDKLNEEKKEEETTGENFESSKTLEAAESIENETSKTIESPKEILDTIQEKQGESMQTKIKNPAVTESTLEEKPQKYESGEKLEHQILSSDGDKIPCLIEEEATQNLEEVPKKEENEKEATDFSETEDSKIAIEKDLEVLAETSDEGNGTETIVLKPKSELDNIVIEDEQKKEESKQLYEDSKDGVNEKHGITEECSTANILPEPLEEKTPLSSEDDRKEEETPKLEECAQLETTSVDEEAEKETLKEESIVDQSRELEVEKIERSSKEDNKVAYNTSESIEQETVEISQGNENKVEKSEGENNIEQIIEESSTRVLIPEPVQQVPVNNLVDEEKKAEETSVETFENPKKEEAAENIAHEASETIESHKEILDTFQVTQVESLQSEAKNQTATESSAEEKINEDKSAVIVAEENNNDNELVDDKDNTEMNVSKGEDDIEQSSQKNEPGEEIEGPLSLISDENQAFSSDVDKLPHLMEEGAQKKEEKETEMSNDTEDNKVPKEKDLQVTDEQSDARKSRDSITLEQKLEMENVEVEEKKEVSEELYEDWNDAGKDKETEKHDIPEEYSSTSVILEPIEEKVLHSSEQDKKEEETRKIEACVPLETSSGDEDAGKQTPKDNLVEESRELDVELEQISKEDDSAAKASKQEGCEAAQTVDGDEDAGKQNIGGEAEKKPEALETANSIPSREKQDIEEDNKQGILCSSVEEGTVEESLQEDESIAVRLKEEVDESNSSSIKKTEVTSSTEETVSETVTDSVESKADSYPLDITKTPEEETPPKEIHGGHVETSTMVLDVSDQDNKEEITAKEGINVDDTDSATVTVATEEICLQEAEPEDKKLVESFGPPYEEKSIVETEAKEIILENRENIDNNVKPEDTSSSGEKREKEISPAADQARGETDHKTENEVPHAGSEDQKEMTTNELSLKEISKEVDYSTITPEENELVTSKASETIDETTVESHATYEDKETTSVAINTVVMEKQDRTIYPSNVSEELEPVDTGKRTTDEEVQQERVEHLYAHSELDHEKSLCVSEDLQISEREEIRELADHSDDCTSKTLENVESSNVTPNIDEALKSTETSDVCTGSEKSIVEQEILKVGSEGIEVEKAAIELKGEAHGQRQEDIDTNDTGTVEEEIFRTADPEEKLQHVSEAVAGDQTESDKSQIDRSCSDNQIQEDEKEVKEKEEPKLEVEDQKEQNANETIKAVLITEKAHEGVEKCDDSEDIKELVVDEEHGFNELHASSTAGETIDKVQESSLVYTKVEDSKENTETETSEVEEVSIKEGGAFVAEQPEEQRVEDGSTSIEPPDDESKEKIEEEVIEESQDGYSKIDNKTLTTVTEKSPEEAELGDKLVKAFHTDLHEACLETTEIVQSQQSKEVDSMKLEETSFDLSSELQTKGHGHAVSESITTENSDMGEPEEIKTASEALYESKGQGSEETDFGKSLTVEKPDQVSTDDHDNADRKNVITENSDTDEVGATKLASYAVDKSQDQGTEGAAETHTGEESLALQNPNSVEFDGTKVVCDAIHESKGQGSEDSAGKSPGVEEPDQIPATNTQDAEKENVAEEKDPVADEVVEPTSSNIVYQFKDQGIDETGKSSTEEKLEVDKSEEGSTETTGNRVQSVEPFTEDEITAKLTPSAEKLEQQLPTPASELPLEHGTTTTVEKTEEEKTEKMEMLEIEGSEDSSTAKPAEEISLQNDALRELKVPKLECTNDKEIKDSPTEVLVHEEGRQTSDDALQLEPPENEKINFVESGESRTAGKPDESEEACKEKSEHKAQDVEPAREGEITAEQTPLIEKLEKQPVITTTVEKIEEEKIEKMETLEEEDVGDSSVAKQAEQVSLLKDSPRELEVPALRSTSQKDIKDSLTEVLVHEGGGQTPDGAIKVEPSGNETTVEFVDASSESKEIIDLSRPAGTACNLKSETNEKGLEPELVIYRHEVLPESQDTEIEEGHLEVITDERDEENQSKKTSEINQIIQTEAAKEEITLEKEVEEKFQPSSLSGEKINESLQEDALKPEECKGETTNRTTETTVTGIHYKELSGETQKAIASETIGEQVVVEDRSVKDSDQVLVENKTIKESFTHESERKDIVASAIEVDSRNQGEESIKEFEEESKLIPETQESGETSSATTEKHISTEADTIKFPETIVSTGREYVPPVLQEGFTETSLKVEAKDLKQGNSEGFHSEVKEVEHGGEKRTDCTEEETIDKSTLADPDKPSLPDLLQKSTKETIQLAKDVTKEKQPTASTEELHTEKAETITVKEEKSFEEKDEAEGEEHQKTDSGSDAPVIVEASRDMDVKVTHKKSHGILAGVGSKVKHSISKVKKAITGKSSHHSKPVSPK